MAHAATAFWHHSHPWISLDAQKDILLGLLANNPEQIGFGVTLRTSWNLIQKQHIRNSSEAEILRKSLDIQSPQPSPLPLRGRGVHGPWPLDHIYVYGYVDIHTYIYI